MEKKKCMSVGPVVGITVTVIAWLLVSVFYTITHVKVEPLQSLFKSTNEHLSYGESRIYRIPEYRGYVDASSYFHSGLVQAYKDIDNVPFGDPYDVKWETKNFEMEHNSYMCDVMFLLPTSSVYMSVESEYPVYAQVLTGSEYEQLAKGQKYKPLKEWTTNESYAVEEGFMDYAICVINNNSRTVSFNYTRSILSARYDQTKAFRLCESSHCVFKNLGYNDYFVITNSRLMEISIDYKVNVGYNELYRYYITSILWGLPVVIIVVVGISVVVSKLCRKKDDSLIQRIYDTSESPSCTPDSSLSHPSGGTVNSEEGSDGYFMYRSDEEDE